jgi:hypothetical protein
MHEPTIDCGSGPEFLRRGEAGSQITERKNLDAIAQDSLQYGDEALESDCLCPCI